jgi:hypothetical protein
MASNPKAPRLVTAIHRGPARYYPHLDRTLTDGDEVPGVTAEQIAGSYYLEHAKPKAQPKES